MTHLTSSRWEALLAVLMLGLFLIVGPWIVDLQPQAQGGHGPCERLCPFALALTIGNMLLRLFTRYNSILESANVASKVLAGQAAIGLIVVWSAVAVALEVAHRLVAAEIVVAACEIVLVGTLLMLAKNADDPRLHNGLVHEVWGVLTLLWVLYVSFCPSWQKTPWVIAPMVIGCLTAQHVWYAVHTVLAELSAGPGGPGASNGARAGTLSINGNTARFLSSNRSNRV